MNFHLCQCFTFGMQMDTAKIDSQRPIVHYSAWEMFGIRECVPPAPETVTVLEKIVAFCLTLKKAITVLNLSVFPNSPSS